MPLDHSMVSAFRISSWHANTCDAVWWPLAVFFLVAAVFREFMIYSPHAPITKSPLVLVAPFLKPANGVGDTPPLPYYLCASHLSTLTNIPLFSTGTVSSGSPSCPSACCIGLHGEFYYQRYSGMSWFPGRRGWMMGLW
jgi:hypothetical protein